MFIYQIYKKFLDLFRKTNNKTQQTKSDIDLTCGIFIKVSNNEDIDISCIIPSLDNCTNKALIQSAEKYAELLVLLNSGLLKTHIFAGLEKHIENTTKIENKLYIDNIIYFYEIFEKHINNNKENHINKPLIKPSLVFRT